MTKVSTDKTDRKTTNESNVITPENQHRNFLIEIGTEELPPKALLTLAIALEAGVRTGLTKAGLVFGQTHYFASPRRLAVLINDLPVFQPARRHERRGPALKVAFDQNGNPTKAAEGFARSCGVAVTDLTTLRTDTGAWLAHTTVERGNATTTIIPEIIEIALTTLPIPKRMRWGDRHEEFVRPVHWLVVLFGDEVISATIMGVSAGRETYGHRFHHPGPLYIVKPTAYGYLLETEGKVIADFAKRREMILAQTKAAALSVNSHVLIDAEVLEEIVALVEWPVALLGSFEPRFLDIPAEVLITTMQDNQRYFPVVDDTGDLMPHFITIANLESRDPKQVIAGNERVIRPRFSDAEFFWIQDRKQHLADHREALKNVVFQQRLGSIYEKSERVADLARVIAEAIGSNPDWAERAAWLSKCDLLTHMVQEFPKLQGIMGRYYARHDEEPYEVAQALEEQYRPRFAGDTLPQTTTGRVLALADRLDTLVGIFAIGQAPSGANDPFALRRAGLGILRIIIEGGLSLALDNLLEHAAHCFRSAVKADSAVEPVFDFLMERLRGYYLEQHFPPDVFEAVLDCRPTLPLDFDRRIRAVTEFRSLPEAESLAAANKRIRNILKKVEGTLPFQVNTELLFEEAERALAGSLTEISSEVVPLIRAGLYPAALTRLAKLREPVDGFFDHVMVMVDEPNLRNNRLAILNELESLFLRIANFSRLQR